MEAEGQWAAAATTAASLLTTWGLRVLGALAILIASTSLSLAGKGSMLPLVVCFAILFLEDARGRKA